MGLFRRLFRSYPTPAHAEYAAAGRITDQLNREGYDRNSDLYRAAHARLVAAADAIEPLEPA